MKRITITNVDEEEYNKFLEICNHLGLSMSEILRICIRDLIKRNEKGEFDER